MDDVDLCPARIAVTAARDSERRRSRRSILLFTSGSSGEPKGVVLSHRNILGNVSQFRVMLDAKKDDAILASLPFFHSFGRTVTLWYPLIEGVRIVTYPNPLEAAKNAALIESTTDARCWRRRLPARLLAQSRAGSARSLRLIDHRRGKIAARSGRSVSRSVSANRFSKVTD